MIISLLNLHESQEHLLSKINKIITCKNFDNDRKELWDTVQKDNIKDFKERQTKSMSTLYYHNIDHSEKLREL